MTITSDELAVLMIAERGEHLLAIGRWAGPCASLTGKGLLQKNFIAGGDQYTITDAGRVAAEKADDSNLGAMIEQGSQVGTAQKSARDHSEQAAKELCDAARDSVKITGDSLATAVRKWADVAMRRALELLNG